MKGDGREGQWFCGRALLLFVFVCFSCGDGNTTKESCPLPSGIEAPEEVIIGGMAIADGGLEAVVTTAIKISIDLVNQDECVLPETRLKLELGYSGFDGGTPGQGLAEFFRIQNTYQPVGWTGFSFSSIARAAALASPLTETPIVGSFSSLADLSDAEVYPFFSRVFPSDAFQGRLFADLCNAYGWDRVATISSTDADASSVHEQFINRAAFHSINSLSTATFPLETNAPIREEYLAQIRSAIRKTKASGARIILLSCLPRSAGDFFPIAIEEGLIGPPYIYLVLTGVTPFSMSVFIDDEDARQAFLDNSRGLIGIQPQASQPGPLFAEWREAWLSADPNEYFGAGEERFARVDTFGFYRDSAYTLAWGIDRLIRRGIDPSDGKALLATIQQETDFYGITGRVLLESNGDRAAVYDIANAQESSLETEMVTIWKANESGLFFEADAVFPDGSTNIPDAAERVFVDWGDAEAIAMMGLFGFGLIVTFVCLVVMMLHRSSPIMNYSSPRFVCGMVAGVVIGFMNVFVWTGEPSSARCEARPWLLVLNFVLIFGHLYAKAFRFLWVMRQRKKLLFRPIPDIHLFLCVFFYLLLFVIPCIVWTVGFPLDVTRSDENPDNDKVNIICDGENSEVFVGVLVGLGGLSLVVGVVVAFLNRNYHDFFSEATYIGYTMFTVCVTCCVVLPMLFILSDTPRAFYVVLMLGVFLGNGAVLVFMLFPKVYVIFSPGKNVVPLDECGALKMKKSSGASVVEAYSWISNPSTPTQQVCSHHNNHSTPSEEKMEENRVRVTGRSLGGGGEARLLCLLLLL